MPTYEYACDRCGPVEIFQSMRDDPLRRCPECGSRRFQRQISAGAGVIFKGNGFYETDYNRSADYRKQADGGGKATEKSGATAAGGSEQSAAAGKAKAAKVTSSKQPSSSGPTKD